MGTALQRGAVSPVPLAAAPGLLGGAGQRAGVPGAEGQWTRSPWNASAASEMSPASEDAAAPGA